jgi:hypothetical protein
MRIVGRERDRGPQVLERFLEEALARQVRAVL